jgi:hypothetical protein
MTVTEIEEFLAQCDLNDCKQSASIHRIKAGFCELCGGKPCHCDRDDNNPVDASAEKWAEVYSKNPDYIDNDHSMDY